MRVTVNKSTPRGSVMAPPSKSMAHRLLICSALAKGESKVRSLEMSEDVVATVSCLRALGVGIDINDKVATVTGGIAPTGDTLYCNESGSTLRFMIPICLTTGKRLTLKGSKRLFARSLSVYQSLCEKHGFEFVQSEDSVTVKGMLQSGSYRVRGDISSQFISGLMFALSMINGESVIEIEGSLESAPYLDLTESALKAFGVNVLRNQNVITLDGKNSFVPRDMTVEGDCSNAAFFEALNYVGGDVCVTGLSPDTLQGDRVYKQFFDSIKTGAPTLDVRDCPDLAPIMMAIGAVYGGVRLVGTRRLKIKESDRGAVMAKELEKFSIITCNYENEITVSGKLTPPHEMLCGHNDHRIVMALATLCVMTGGTIDGAEAVNKSLPDYFERLEKLGTEVIYETR